MKRWRFPRIVGVVLVLAYSLGQAGCAALSKVNASSLSDDLERLRDEVAGRCKQMEQAMRDNDLMKVASFYTDDAILMSKSDNKRGGSREAIEEYWKRFGTGIDWSLSVESIRGVDSLIVHHGRSVLTYITKNERHTSEVEFMLLWIRQEDGVLSIAFDVYW